MGAGQFRKSLRFGLFLVASCSGCAWMGGGSGSGVAGPLDVAGLEPGRRVEVTSVEATTPNRANDVTISGEVQWVTWDTIYLANGLALPRATIVAVRELSKPTTFLHDVAYGESGFPIRAAGKLAVVYWDPDAHAGALALSGDFNGWSTGASPLDQPVMGFPLYVRIEDDPKPAGRSLYKLVRGGAEWLADPMARRYGYDPNGEYSLLEAGVAAGHLERWPDFREGAGKPCLVAA